MQNFNNVLIAHVRNRNGGIEATVALRDGKIGVSVKNPVDKDNKKLGIKKAIGRTFAKKEKMFVCGKRDRLIRTNNGSRYLNSLISDTIDYLIARAIKLNEANK